MTSYYPSMVSVTLSCCFWGIRC